MMRLLTTGALIAMSVALSSATTAVAQNNATTGDSARGETLFTTTYKCYACHGYDAQTGQRRLKPMRFSEEAFTVFVQNSPLAQMPSYPDAPSRALADIYAYILSIPVDAPEVDEIPLLQSILDEKLDALEN